MAVTDSYQSFVVEQLARVASGIRARRMFGGVGIYSIDLFFALIDGDALYLKTDAASQPKFEALGTEPFRPAGEDGEAMGYHQLPTEILETLTSCPTGSTRHCLSPARRARSVRGAVASNTALPLPGRLLRKRPCSLRSLAASMIMSRGRTRFR